MAITKTLRFEVFKRDKFTCQYCGRSAPDIVLQADHIQPVSKGGSDELLNLVTSCFDCNSGKSNRLLSDDSIIKRQKQQLDLLQERREQLEMMMEWQRSLLSFNNDVVDELTKFWGELTGWCLSEVGLTDLRGWLKKFTLEEILEAMRIAFEHYVEADSKGCTQETVNKAFNKIPGICYVRKRGDLDKPYLKDIYYVRATLRGRLSYVNEQLIMPMLEGAVLDGVPVQAIRQLAKQARSWTGFRDQLAAWQEEMRQEAPEDQGGE